MSPVSLRTIALAITLSVLLTSGLVGAWLIHRSWTSQHELMHRQLQRLATTLAESVDRELTSGARKLQAIALGLPADPDSARADLQRRARDLLAINTDMRAIVLNDPRGSQIWNTRLPSSADVAPRVFEHEQRAIASMEPLLTDLYPSRSTGEPIVSYVVPVYISGAPRVLVGSIDPAELARRLQPLASAEGAVASLLDRQGRIVARTSDGNDWLGAQVGDDWADALDDGDPAGLAPVVTREGVPAYGAWARMPENGWTLLVAVPRAPHRQALQGLMLQLGAVAVLAALGAMIAYLLGRALVSGASRVAADAERVAVERELAPARTGIKEFDTIQHGLVQAAARLKRQDEEAQAQQRARAEVLDKERAARQAAEEAIRFKNESLGVLGHEMRSPLAAVANAARALAHRVQDDPKGLHMVQAIQRQSGTLTRLVNDLLEAGRLIGGHMRLDELRPVDLAEVVREACQVLALSGASARHAVESELPPALVLGDHDRLLQVVTNLMTNALRYSPPGSTVHVSLRSVQDASGQGRVAELRVRDEGMGLRPQDLERVFGMFVQALPRQQHSGLGIGLSVVRRLVELHGGQVRAESAGPGQGASFVVTLPALPEQPVQQPG